MVRNTSLSVIRWTDDGKKSPVDASYSKGYFPVKLQFECFLYPNCDFSVYSLLFNLYAASNCDKNDNFTKLFNNFFRRMLLTDKFTTTVRTPMMIRSIADQ